LPELSPAQRELAETPGSVFAEACPGAGKTRAIVARYLAAAVAEQRRGIALLSFTNAAIDEARARCTSPRALVAPNFVGTFDTFINRFISGPAFATKHGAAARFVPAWDEVPAATFKVYGLAHYLEFNLEWFNFGDDGTARNLRAMGLVSDKFSPESIATLTGSTAIGHTRYSTTGSSTIENAQPVLVRSRGGAPRSMPSASRSWLTR